MASKLPVVKLFPCQAEVFDDVRDDSARHVAAVPCEGDEAMRVEGIRVVSVAAGSAQQFAADFAQPPIELAAVPGGELLADDSGDQDELIAEGRWDRAARFPQRFEMRLRRLLKVQDRFAAIASVRVAAGQQCAPGDENAVFITPDFDLRDRDDHAMNVRRSRRQRKDRD